MDLLGINRRHGVSRQRVINRRHSETRNLVNIEDKGRGDSDETLALLKRKLDILTEVVRESLETSKRKEKRGWEDSDDDQNHNAQIQSEVHFSREERTPYLETEHGTCETPKTRRRILSRKSSEERPKKKEKQHLRRSSNVG